MHHQQKLSITSMNRCPANNKVWGLTGVEV